MKVIFILNKFIFIFNFLNYIYNKNQRLFLLNYNHQRKTIIIINY